MSIDTLMEEIVSNFGDQIVCLDNKLQHFLAISVCKVSDNKRFPKQYY